MSVGSIADVKKPIRRLPSNKLTEPFKFWEAPHPHKEDGSHTNW